MKRSLIPVVKDVVSSVPKTRILRFESGSCAICQVCVREDKRSDVGTGVTCLLRLPLFE